MICKAEFLVNLLLNLLGIGMMIYLCEEPLVVMLILGFGLLLSSLMTFWIVSIFLFESFGNAFLIFKVFIAMLEVLLLLVELDEA